MTDDKKRSQNKKIVLLVDDDPLIARMYQNKLSQDGHEVLLAANGDEALVWVAKKKPDLILLDLMMPKMNGVETLKMLKKEPKTANIPVIILTNLGDRPEDKEKAKELGALEYLVKAEISLKELSQKVKETIH